MENKGKFDYEQTLIHLDYTKGWKRNGVGLMYNCRFGFGLVNSEELVKAALKWTNVPRKTTCYIQARAKYLLFN